MYMAGHFIRTLRDDLEAFADEEAEALQMAAARRAARASNVEVRMAIRAAAGARANRKRVQRTLAQEETELAGRAAAAFPLALHPPRPARS